MEKKVKKIELQVYEGKTKCMTANRDRRDQTGIISYGYNDERVSQFKCLGSVITEDNGVQTEKKKECCLIINATMCSCLY